MKSLSIKTAFYSFLILAALAWAGRFAFNPAEMFSIRGAGLFFAVYGFVLFFIQFVLVSRIRIIERSWGLDKMFGSHRVYGRLALIALIFHGFIIIANRILAAGSFSFSFYTGIGAVVLAGLTITASLASFHRQLNLLYEIWRNIHLANYILFPIALVHVFNFSQPGSMLQYYWVSLSLLFISLLGYRLARIVLLHRFPYTVSAVKQEAEKIWTIEFSGPRLDYKPGQFMFLQLVRRGGKSSPHPLTISSSPVRENLSVTPKEIGDFTATIGKTKAGEKALIDAPYGTFSFLNHELSELVFLAGGIGITPFISMLRYMYDLQLDLKVTLFWSNRDSRSLCFKNELELMEKELPGLKIVTVMTGDDDWDGVKGRLNIDLLKEELKSLEEKHFYLCGPPAMIRKLRKDLKTAGIADEKVHYELFEL